jgi:hypothetical protein
LQIAEKQFVGAGRDVVRNPLAEHRVEFVGVVGVQLCEPGSHRGPMAADSCIEDLLPHRCSVVMPPTHRCERILAMVQALMAVEEQGRVV